MEISVVIPLFNEEGSLTELHKTLSEVLYKLNYSYELLFIDDGSTDSSNDIIKDLRNSDPHIRLLTFRRNRGKSAALSVGFKASCGKYVVTMDADLQDDPKEIPNLIHELNNGYDLVTGWKRTRHDPLNKVIPSRIFNTVTSFVSGIKLHDFNCGLKGYRSEVIKEIKVYGERHRFLPVLAHMHGFKISEIPVKHHPRIHGQTKYGAYRFIAGFLDLITLLFKMKFLSKPMHLFGSLGMIGLIVGVSIVLYLSIGWFMGHWIGNRPLLLYGILAIITGVQLFTLGLLGEMIVENRIEEDPPLRHDSDLDQREEK